ncbi:DUF6660 family protein [Pontibacter rugosus]|uniref:DUF6660 family protein n=1 Tax=Pontibacter rugosus TaxID=1745966 RepID=A0ABW3SMG3_9BACT
MRFILSILILLLLALSLKPCMDRGNVQASAQQTVALSDTHQDHEGERTDECTPFCACHCCHTHFQLQNVELAEYASSQYLAQTVDLYKNSFVSSLFYSIWQPPKVA